MPPFPEGSKANIPHKSQDGTRLARVAEDVGYASETAFNRAFKREFGHSPQRWRRQFAR